MSITSFHLKTISFQAFSSHQHRPDKASTLPAVLSATNPTRIRRPGVAQKVAADREDFKKQNDSFHLFQAFAASQKNYERFGGRNLSRYTYKQAFQHFNALNAIFSKTDKAVLTNYMAQHPDPTLFRKLKEIADLRRNYIRTVGSKNFEERTDQSAARLRAEGFFAGLPRLFRNARRETGKLKQARKQNPYTSRSSQFMREETKREMQNTSYLQRLRFLLSPHAQTKEQLRVLMRWLKLSETDKLSPKPFLKPSEHEDLKYALAETHKMKLYYNKVFQLCKAICIVFVCAFSAWKAGSELIERWHVTKTQAALEQISNKDSSSSSPSKVTADVLSGTDND